jgi:hypothetical protein
MYFCVGLCIVCFVTFPVLFVYMCTEQLPPGGYPVAVKYIIPSYVRLHISDVINLFFEMVQLLCNPIIIINYTNEYFVIIFSQLLTQKDQR